MTYYTVNAKIKAMGQGSGNLENDTARILHYIHDRPLKKFVEALAEGLISGTTDVDYYLTLWRNINVLDKFSRSAMRKVISAEIDMRNILWMYRLKRFYGMVGGETFGYLIPVGGRLSSVTIGKMTACRNVTELIEEVNQTQYKNVFGDFSQGEEKLQNAVIKLYQREIQTNPNTITTICAHLFQTQTKE